MEENFIKNRRHNPENIYPKAYKMLEEMRMAFGKLRRL